MSKLILYIFLFMILLLVLSFSVNNSHTVNLNYFLGSVDLPLALLLVLTLSVGAILGALVMLRPVLSLRMEVGRLRRGKRAVEQELNGLRSLSVKEQ
ncbi:MAG: LapA family protein [Gammaproteobacteria bacterium]|nr:LapA family protein [Gammaproteobacteria bacterium]